jgi:hypothetical protein
MHQASHVITNAVAHGHAYASAYRSPIAGSDASTIARANPSNSRPNATSHALTPHATSHALTYVNANFIPSGANVHAYRYGGTITEPYGS